jgi:cupin fold WbuC family metalloprotein
MVINQSLLNQLTEQAKASPRLRMNYDLRNSEDDGSQRMLNAIEPGSPERIHRHQHTSETVVCLRGRVVEEFYDDLERICTDSIVLTPNGPNVAINIPAGQWHSIRAVESGSVVLSCKDGRYEPMSEADILSL